MKCCAAVPPFYDSDPLKMLNRVVLSEQALAFPEDFDEEAKSLILALLQTNPSLRPRPKVAAAYTNADHAIEGHSFFRDVAFELFRQRARYSHHLHQQ